VELSKDLITDEKLNKFIDSEEDVRKVISRQLEYTKEYQEVGIHHPQWVNIPRVLRAIVSFKETGSLNLRLDIHGLELYCDPVIEKVFSHRIENTQKHGEKATEIHTAARKPQPACSSSTRMTGSGSLWRGKKNSLSGALDRERVFPSSLSMTFSRSPI